MPCPGPPWTSVPLIVSVYVPCGVFMFVLTVRMVLEVGAVGETGRSYLVGTTTGALLANGPFSPTLIEPVSPHMPVTVKPFVGGYSFRDEPALTVTLLGEAVSLKSGWHADALDAGRNGTRTTARSSKIEARPNSKRAFINLVPRVVLCIAQLLSM